MLISELKRSLHHLPELYLYTIVSMVLFPNIFRGFFTMGENSSILLLV